MGRCCGEARRREERRERAQRSEPRDRSEPSKWLARERVGESEGRSPRINYGPVLRRGKAARRKTRASAAKRATRPERAVEVARERACRGVRGAQRSGELWDGAEAGQRGANRDGGGEAGEGDGGR